MGPDFGRIAVIDLTARTVSELEPGEDLVRNWLGGRGFVASWLYDALTPDTLALGSANPLVVACGFLTGTEALCSSRVEIGARSPLTGLVGISNVGGYFGSELRRCGFLALVIAGEADSPVVIDVVDDGVSIRDARDIWGSDTNQTVRTIRARYGRAAQALCIGPAGELLVHMASIIEANGHAAGRTGLGAVMGAKKVKAIVAKASRRPGGVRGGADPGAIRRYYEAMTKAANFERIRKYGTSNLIRWSNDLGAGTAYNYRAVQFAEVDRLTGVAMEKYVLGHKGCYRCPVHCRAELRITQGTYAGFVGERPEYEPAVALGPKCGNADLEALIFLHNLTNALGLDAIEAGNVTAFAMDLYSQGIITREMAAGLQLSWGNTEAMVSLLNQVAYRSSWLGDVLARGIPSAAQTIGNGAEQYARHVKGMGMTAMDPRGFKASALGYAVGSRGGDFTTIYARPEYSYSPERAREEFGTEAAADRLSELGKPLMVRKCNIASAAVDAVGVCKVPQFSILDDYRLSYLEDLVGQMWGLGLTRHDLALVGERILNAERLINVKLGATREHDTLPRVFLEDPVAEGPSRGSVVALDGMRKEYYRLMGWDEEGRPTRRKLEELGILPAGCT